MPIPPVEFHGTPLPRPLRSLVEDARDRLTATRPPEPDTVADRLQRAMRAEALAIAYQPIVELADRRLVAFEALVRIGDPAFGDLGSPAQVIGVAEASGGIHALGTEVLTRACSQLAIWRTAPHLRHLQVHVNVSPLQLRDPGFVETVERSLAVTRLPSTALVLEITETTAFEMNETATVALATLSALAVEISIDDFGTGFASLEMLASTPARSIKLDRSFVASVGEPAAPPRGRALVVQAAIGLGRSLGLRVIAEGIETAAQARTLASWGCLYGQGYLYAKPERIPGAVVDPPAAVGDRPATWDRRPHLSSDAIDLALAVAAVISTADPHRDSVRSDAQELALHLAESLGFDRRQVDTTAVLATIADAPQRFPDVVGARSPVPASVELARLLDSRSDLGPDAHPGGVAAAARRLAIARHDGTTLDEALAAIAASATDTVRERITSWWVDATPSPSPLRELRGMERRLRSRDDATRRLRALSALTRAIGGSGSLEDVLDVTAEEARDALGAASLSIVRLDREHGLLRVLVNVGDLAPWEERRPHDVVYPVTDFPNAMERLLNRSIHLQVAGAEEGGATNEARLLADYDRGSSASVPIVVDATTWGEVYATTAPGAPPFTVADAPFLTAIASVVSLAIRRFEHVDQLTRLVGEDPLTRIANRRALEGHLARALAPGREGSEVALLLFDIDGLKRVNDRYGHGEGDRVLVRVADVIARVALTRPGAFAARLGGDEFCIVLEGDGGDAADLVDRIRVRLAAGPTPRPNISAGLATARSGTISVDELLQRADAAEELARRTGARLATIGPESAIPGAVPGPVSDRIGHAIVELSDDLSEDAIDAPIGAPTEDTTEDTTEETTAHDGGHLGSRAAAAALRHWGSTLGETSLPVRLDGLGEAAGALLDLNRWVVSELPQDSDQVRTRSVHTRRRRPSRPEFRAVEGESFALADYPTTLVALRDGVGFSVHVDDPSADPAERARVAEYGQRYVMAVPASAGTEHWLLALYGDDRSTPLPEARPVLEALATRTFGREIHCPSART